MQIADFLARVVAPGNFLVISHTFEGTDRQGKAYQGFSNRFFPYADIADAASWAGWQARHNHDVYYGLASYNVAIANGTDKLGRPRFNGERKQVNTQSLRALWMDLDVSRPGDGKAAANVFATRDEARAWLKGFLAATGLLNPNMLVDSGYGYHAYWILEDPLPTADWQVQANALRAAMVAHGYKGDAGITVDSARVLRPPETVNMKSGQPVTVNVRDKFTRADYPNQLVLGALQPFIGLATVATIAQPVAASTGASALAGGGASVQALFAGRQSMTGAMQAGVSTTRPRFFAKIAPRCEQVKLSLANHGKGEDRPLWYLGNVTLAVHCQDGAQFLHGFSDGDARYSQANVDAHFARAQAEHATKGNGPPTCSHYDKVRPGVCQGCPFLGRVTTPWQLGLDQPDDADLPPGYRRNNNNLEYSQPHPKEGLTWHPMLVGDVAEPVLDRDPKGGFVLGFNYYRDDKAARVRVSTGALKPDVSAIYDVFQAQDVVLHPRVELQWRAFILAWIEQLRSQRSLRDEDIQSFGYTRRGDEYSGLAIGGTIYRTDGTEEHSPGTDPVLVRDYTPSGSLDKWRAAANFVMKDRLDLQLIIAVAFASPLMTFTGHSGVVFSAWSQQSAVGKSSALKVGRAVWSRETTSNSLDDTPNSILKRMGDTRIMPCWWDEMRGSNKERREQMVELALSITQGKGKSRLSSSANLMDVGEWQTILMCCSNYPLMEHVLAATQGTDSGAVRLFEWNITRPALADTSQAARLIMNTRHHYGVAGRVYAKWVAANLDKVDRMVCSTKDMLVVALTPDQAERFYIAGMAVCLVGAAIAKRLGLCDFDVAGLHNFLVANFLRMRNERRGSTLINAHGVDAEQILALFMADHLAHKLITSKFAPPNVNRYTRLGASDIKWQPTNGSRVDIHISQLDKTIRISRPVFAEWCHRRSFPATVIVDAFEKRWGATCARQRMGAGTGYSQGQMVCIDIPAVQHPLDEYLLLDGQQTQQAAPTPGNKPTV